MADQGGAGQVISSNGTSRSPYDFMVTRILDWPSLTVEWLTGKELVLGTQESLWNAPNYLLVALVILPDDDDPSTGNGKIYLVQHILHEGKVNKARHMPQCPVVIATKTDSSEVFVFETSKHPSIPRPGARCNPEIRLRGHNAKGLGLAWSPFRPGYLLSGSEDSKTCVWDISANPNNNSLDAFLTFNVHGGAVRDVAWHPCFENIFGSVGDDRYLHVYDIRTPIGRPIFSTLAHERQATCLAFGPSISSHIIATGSADKTVKLFDSRNLNAPLHTLKYRRGEVSQVGWRSDSPKILTAGCRGGRLLVWDLARMTEIRTPENASDDPPELIFVHHGHTSTDFSWNPEEPWVMASVADDTRVQVWMMAERSP